jgi:hypothetical protein
MRMGIAQTLFHYRAEERDGVKLKLRDRSSDQVFPSGAPAIIRCPLG